MYFDKFKEVTGGGNFGDDINPALMGKFIRRSILTSEDVALFGVGTILNDKNILGSRHYPRKVVFTSGVGYGPLDSTFDDSWDIACVRGPRSAKKLGLGADRAIADGAILLSQMYEKPSDINKRPLFIPHVNSHLSTGSVLAAIADKLNMDYISPGAEASEFISKVARAPFVVTEAMHGAILADTMRVPWIPVGLHEHFDFKWRDWMESVGLDKGNVFQLSPKCWDPKLRSEGASPIRSIYRKGKEHFLLRAIRNLVRDESPLLSATGVLEEKKAALLKVAEHINDNYG
ncbi:polysaccharide pyruvyl transferase family protein [Marinobacter sp.]|uniref:polysaccharide pyruvyl transferase family protein n=1 Tax=Marinobacter sp. TaxID=50741 RepID=UPI0025C295B7|nr:polysaccharide pyruvyl transferase family protein [Marinobacter sp.]